MSVPDAPDREYFENEVNPMKFRWRASASDIGAFESTTMGTGYGPYDDPGVSPTGGAGAVGGNGAGGGSTGGAGSGADGSGAAPGTGANAGTDSGDGSDDDSGCGCRTVGAPSPGGPWALLLLAAIVAVRRERHHGSSRLD